MREREKQLLDVAESISDGRPVAWQELSDSFSEREDQEVLSALKVIADVAAVQRLETSTAPRLEAPVQTELRRWAHLHVLEKIGEGAHGEVFRAFDPRLDREVALKLLYKDAQRSGSLTSIMREGQHLARVKHANVATVYGADQDRGRVGIWMELIRGRTLAEIIEEHGPYGATEATIIGIELSKAIAAIHSTGLVHRDIKAQNVMREEGGRLVLADFGIVRGVGAELESDIPRGTPLCMAPELLLGAPTSKSADIYAVGVLLYYLVTGTYPVNAVDLQGLRAAHERGEKSLLRVVSRVPTCRARLHESLTELSPESPSGGSEPRPNWKMRSSILSVSRPARCATLGRRRCLFPEKGSLRGATHRPEPRASKPNVEDGPSHSVRRRWLFSSRPPTWH